MAQHVIETETGIVETDPISVFISLPMHDKTDEEISDAIKKAEETVRDTVGDKCDVTFVENFSTKYPDNYTRPQLLAQALMKLATCDFIYFTGAFWSATGCRVEQFFAMSYGIREFNEWTFNEYLREKYGYDPYYNKFTKLK